MTRVLTALVLLSVLWPITELGPRWAFVSLAAAIIAAATWECYRLLAARGARPFTLAGLAAVLAVVWSFSETPPRFGVELPLALLAIAAPLLAMWRRPDTRRMAEDTVATLFPAVFVGLTLAHIVRVRQLPGEDGRDLLYMLFVCVILSDTAAYYVGTLIGRRRMAPGISPKKSWEGTLGGAAASVGGALLAHAWFYQRLPLGHALILGILLGTAGIFGDLAESMLKRAAAVKDSASLLPGHGGVLDRTDSLLFSAPLLYYYYVAFLAGTAASG